MHSKLIRHLLISFVLLFQGSTVFAAYTPGQTPPAPTALQQELNSTSYAGGFRWTPVTLPWLTNGSQTAFGGSLDTSSRLSVNPQGTGENGLTVKMPSGYYGQPFQIVDSTNTTKFSVDVNGLTNTGSINATGDLTVSGAGQVGAGIPNQPAQMSVLPQDSTVDGLAIQMPSTTSTAKAIRVGNDSNDYLFSVDALGAVNAPAGITAGTINATSMTATSMTATGMAATSITAAEYINAGGDMTAGRNMTVIGNSNLNAYAGIGATASSADRLAVNPQGTSENGLKIKMPSGSSANALQINNSVGSTLASISSYGDLVIAGRLNVGWDMFISGDSHIYGREYVTGNSYFTNNLNVTGNLTVGKNMAATGYASSVRFATTANTATLTDSVLLCNGTFTETLPSTGWPTGYRLTVKDTGTGTITLTAGGTVTFDGATTLTFATQYKSRVLIWDGTKFQIESGYL